MAEDSNFHGGVWTSLPRSPRHYPPLRNMTTHPPVQRQGVFNLADNALSGDIPKWISETPAVVDLSGNQFDNGCQPEFAAVAGCTRDSFTVPASLNSTTKPQATGETQQQNSAEPESTSSGLSGGAIAGIVIGVLAFVAAMIAGVAFVVKRRTRSAAPGLPTAFNQSQAFAR